MKRLPLLALGSALCTSLTAAEPVVEVKVFPGSVRAVWSTPPAQTAHALTLRRWQLEHSTDLRTWTPQGNPVTSDPGGIGFAGLDFPKSGPQGFIRLRVTDEPSYLAASGAEVLGYVSALDGRIAENAAITPADVAGQFPAAGCLPQVSYDVQTAEYWTEWNTDPAVHNAPLPVDSPDRRLTDFRLNAAEQALLAANGFVVSEARGSISFTDLYYRVWTDDLPVYVSSDSILHAWHRTWITMLEELEELALRPRLVTVVNGLRDHLSSAVVPAALSQARTDAAGYLQTAGSLLAYLGTLPQPPTFTQYGRAVAASSVSWDEPFFGSTRIVDWTQFGPRAHYTNSETLKSYFRTMMWLALVDMRMDAREPGTNAPRQLAAACMLSLALRDAGLLDEWEELDRILTPFTGTADALTPPQLLEILDAEGLGTMAAFTSQAKLETLLTRIMAGQAGVQQITGHPIPAPMSETALVLPRSFVFFPQRFTPESWAFSRMVFDKIWRANPDPSGPPLVRVRRRLPSALDINFAVMGNNTPAPLLAQRMTITGGVPFRDGYDFSRELVSVRQVLDAADPATWTGSLYLHCLGALRSLSSPLPSTAPEAMRTEAWKWKTVHTQLAGWTELRHDNLLYAKQSYTPPVLCDYPAGYVEPRPEFYAAMRQMADFARAAISPLVLEGYYPGRPVGTSGSYTLSFRLEDRKRSWLDQFESFSNSMSKLKELAEKEISQEPFTQTQTDFMRSLVQSVLAPYVSASGRTYSGWYPQLYLQSAFAGPMDPHPSEMWDPLVADLHTDGPDEVSGDPGAVLYNATGNAALMLVCIDVNGRRCLHGGPVFTYYEFTGGYSETRLNDQAWKAKVRAKEQPAPPEWTGQFLVPGPITVPVDAQ